MNFIEPESYVGKRYGRLLVVSAKRVKDSNGRGRTVLDCICDCGSKKQVESSSAKSGKSLSCRCLRIDLNLKTFTTHGEASKSARSDEYQIYMAMKNRCYLKSNKHYHLYGGRGIGMSDEWKNDFMCFLSDMGRRPSPAHSIDRIDNEKGYSKENCRWATPKEQANNKRSTVRIEHYGMMMTISEMASMYAIPFKHLEYRIKKKKMGVADAVFSAAQSLNKSLLQMAEGE